jgi:hypothetical protein
LNRRGIERAAVSRLFVVGCRLGCAELQFGHPPIGHEIGAVGGLADKHASFTVREMRPAVAVAE